MTYPKYAKMDWKRMKAPIPKKPVKKLGLMSDYISSTSQHSHRDEPMHTRVLSRPSKAKHGDRDAERCDRCWFKSDFRLRDDTPVGVENRFEVDVNVVTEDET